MTDAKTAKPWDSWPVELPQAAELRATPEFKKLQDPEFKRAIGQQVRARFFEKWSGETKEAAVVLKGGVSEEWALYDSDTDKTEFRQEAFFRYLFPINEPDCYAVLDLEKKHSILFVPFIPDSAERWNGERRPLEWYTEMYGVTVTHLTDDIAKELKARNIKKLFTLYGQNGDSDRFTTTVADFKGIEEFTVDKAVLHPFLSELRVHKTPLEIELMRIGALVTCQAHVYVMRHIKPGMFELHCEAMFKAWTGYFGASRHVAYTCICGSGCHGAILHYGHAARPNDKVIQDGECMVLDMGGEYNGYATDITRSYPVNGRFTPEQKVVFNAVYEAQQACFKAMKPGVSYPDMHRLAERVIIEHLSRAGILHNGTVEEMVAAHMGAVFMPHGLGHLLGLNTHDVGGYPGELKRSAEPGLCWLRLGRKLEPGMVVTVEPGVYFNDKVIDKALADPARAKFINAEVLKKYRGMGGVRLEDDVLITDTGIENFTILPTTVEEIEEVMGKVRKTA